MDSKMPSSSRIDSLEEARDGEEGTNDFIAPIDEPMKLRDDLAKTMEQLKQLRESDVADPMQEQERQKNLDIMLDSYKEAISIINRYVALPPSDLFETSQMDTYHDSEDDKRACKLMPRACEVLTKDFRVGLENPLTTNSMYEDGDGSSKLMEKKYKRRRASASWIVIVSAPPGVACPDDGYSWRKYGQKDILGCNYPRAYYRCTFKYEGCKATKQVQRCVANPDQIQVTYHGRHTCSKELHHPE